MSDSLATTNFTLGPGAELGGEFPFALNVKAVGAVGDGITDDTQAIQYALNFVAGAGGGAVFAPSGIYLICGLSIPSNVEFFGTGWQSILRVRPNATCPYAIVNENQAEGDSNIAVRDLAVDGNKAVSGPIPSATLIFTAETGFQCENVRVERVYVHDANSLGIVFVNCNGYAAIANLVTDNNRDGITSYFNCESGVIYGNRIERVNDDSIGLNAENLETEEHVLQNVVIANNVILGPAPNPGSYGAITLRGCRHCSVYGNVIDSVRQFGIVALDMNASPVGDVLIANNLLTLVGEEGEGFRPAIALYAGLLGHAGINDVTIIGNHIREPASHGIFLENDLAEVDGVQNVNIIGNFIERAGTNLPPEFPVANGIYLNDSVMQDIRIEGNVSHDNTGWGIRAVTFANRIQSLFCNNNTCFDNIQSGIFIQGVVGGSAIGNSTHNQETVEEGGPQQWGIRLRSLAGEWTIAHNVSYNNTRDYEYAALGEAQFRDSFFGAEPILKPEITGKKEGGPALKQLLIRGQELGLWKDATT